MAHGECRRASITVEELWLWARVLIKAVKEGAAVSAWVISASHSLCIEYILLCTSSIIRVYYCASDFLPQFKNMHVFRSVENSKLCVLCVQGV